MVDRIPDDFSFKLLDPDWEKFAIPLREGLHRLPALEAAGFERFVNGPESFTPDSNFLLGETPELAGLFVAAGFNSAGIATAGGAGEVLARWIIDGEQPMDLWSADIRRFTPALNNRAFLRDRVTEALERTTASPGPTSSSRRAEDLRTSSLHDRLAARGASSARRWEWNAHCGSPSPTCPRLWNTLGAGRTGSTAMPPNTGPPASQSRCSTNRRSRNSCFAAGTQCRSCNGYAATTWTCRMARSFIPACSMTGARSRAT